ncbi:hypothetical protein HMN09_00486400 [Mycena chlorophos]|uniref:CCHC-type domain-containing protein n=1 Tax=Mycena chlorophos TaxID=658473 RepID=A0A8H6T733_MYCCL|nr:hypothetical protein HMN09_00486400 [Mycena chlorophos]
MASRKSSCYKCGNLGHIAENCSSAERLCYNCRQPGHESAACPSPRTVAAKQCYSCGGGLRTITADCPTLRIQQSGGQRCYNCGKYGHISKVCPAGSLGFAARPAPSGRALNTATLPPVKCYRCGQMNHYARDCLAPPGTEGGYVRPKTCYRCQQEGHIARDCPELQTYTERKHLPYTRQQLYDVVSDVASYRHFIPYCSASRILSSSDPTKSPLLLEAELTVQFLAFKESYVSQVTCIPLESVEAIAASTTPLFKELKTTWRFREDAPPPSPSTLVSLDLAYAFANPLHGAISASFFGQVSKMMVQAFEERCAEVYGRNS